MDEINIKDLDVEVTTHKTEDRIGLRVTGAEEMMSELINRIDVAKTLADALKKAKVDVEIIAEQLVDEYNADTIRFLSNEDRSVDVLYSYPTDKPLVKAAAKEAAQLPTFLTQAMFTEKVVTQYIPKDDARDALEAALTKEHISEKQYKSMRKKLEQHFSPSVTVKQVASTSLPWSK